MRSIPARCSGVKESAVERKSTGTTGDGNRYLAKVLGEAAVIAGKIDTFLGECYRRIAQRRGKKTAIVAVEDHHCGGGPYRPGAPCIQALISYPGRR